MTACTCGIEHADCVTRAFIGPDALTRLAALTKENGHRSILLVCDSHTEKFARKVEKRLGEAAAGIFIYPDNPSPGAEGDSSFLVPDEAAVGRLLIASGTGYDALMAVGSGTLNDLARYVSYRIGLPYYIAATAASMDGYTSSVAPLIVDGLKQTYAASAPLAVAGDPAVLNTADWSMTAAGYGDIAGKWTSVNDWELEYILTEKGYCAKLADEMRAVARDCAEAVGPSAEDSAEATSPIGKPETAGLVMDALVRSGLIMQQVGNSKPASGGEHHLSHFWEMSALLQGRQPALHGAKVGVAVLVVLRMAEWLADEPIDWESVYREADAFDPSQWRQEIHAAYVRAAEGVIAQWAHETAAIRRAQAENIRRHWPALIETARQKLPPYAEVLTGLRRMGCPTTPKEIGVSRIDFVNGIRHAFRIRPRVTLLRIADTLGLLPAYAQRLADELGEDSFSSICFPSRKPKSATPRA